MPPKNKKKEVDNETLTRIAIVSADRFASAARVSKYPTEHVPLSTSYDQVQHSGGGGCAAGGSCTS